MGVTIGAVCVKCGVEAPELGDFGFMGLPIADSRKRRGTLQSFGFIYAGLAAVGAMTEEIEAFHAVLLEHGKHRLDYGSRDFGNAATIRKPPRRTRPFRFDMSHPYSADASITPSVF